MHGVRAPVGMKARHFARRFSLQPLSLVRDNSNDSSKGDTGRKVDPPCPPDPKHTHSHPRTERRHASGSATCIETKEGEKFKKKYRVVVMGPAKVGKTAIINQFLYDSFTPKYTKTIEEMHHGEYEISSMCLTLEILDTSGSYEFPAMRDLSVKCADAFILVYSITDAESFEEVRSIREYILTVKKTPIPIVVVGNKLDLEEERAIPLETAETIVLLDWENGFIESSAKDNHNVVQIFKELLNQAKIKYALSPAVKRRRQSMPNVGLQVTAAQLHHLNHIKLKANSKRNSCVIQ
ncbi:Small GTP-binding protein domain [Trinorchestia longiramus]|nr:Small GTP-binding protein domain [Trinorchestia longiramus]